MRMKTWDKLSAEIAMLRGMIGDIRKASANGPVSVQIVHDELIIEPLVCGAGGVGGSSAAQMNAFPPFQPRPLPVSQAYDSAVLARLAEDPFNGCDLDGLVESIRAVGTSSPAAHRDSVILSLHALGRKGLVVARDTRDVRKIGLGSPILRWFAVNLPPAVPSCQ